MLTVRRFVLLSWLLSSLLIGAALFSTPPMRYQLTDKPGAEGLLMCVSAFCIGALLCGWPWLAAYSLGKSQQHRSRQAMFAIGALALAIIFYWPIASASDIGIGANIIFYVLLVWAAYPLSSLLEDERDSAQTSPATREELP